MELVLEIANRPTTQEGEDQAILSAFRHALTEISHILELPGSPDLTQLHVHLKREVEGWKRAIADLTQEKYGLAAAKSGCVHGNWPCLICHPSGKPKVIELLARLLANRPLDSSWPGDAGEPNSTRDHWEKEARSRLSDFYQLASLDDSGSRPRLEPWIYDRGRTPFETVSELWAGINIQIVRGIIEQTIEVFPGTAPRPTCPATTKTSDYADLQCEMKTGHDGQHGSCIASDEQNNETWIHWKRGG